MPRNVRTVYAYELHGHDANGVLDYRTYFTRLAELNPPERSFTLRDDSDQVVAIPEIRVREGRFHLRFVSGREGDPAIFHDLRTGAEREASPRENEMPIHSSWLIVDTESRVVVQERRRPGVPLGDVVAALVAIGRDHGFAINPTLSLHPVVDKSFSAGIDDLVRIRSAALVVSRPNQTWTNAVNSIITQLGQESHGGSAEVAVTARPNESLDHDTGIVGELKEMVDTQYGPLRSARVVGFREGDERPTTVSTRNHARRREVKIPDGATRAQEQEAMLAGADQYVEDLSQDYEPEQ
jgi:hypothetical protein